MFTRATWVGIVAVLAILMVPMHVVAQDGGTITGQVVEEAAGQPVTGVDVSIPSLGRGTQAQDNGRFLLRGVPAGTYTLRAQRLGFRTAEVEVTVTEGETTTVTLTMAHQPLSMEGIVATGLVDPTEGVRSPISVDRVDREMIPVVVGASSAVQNLQGRVAGLQMSRPSGQPGEEVVMNLRTPTTVTGSSRPLVVVDGVILEGGLSSIESMDIESMEVVKGAAAASLYGSRAAAGVVVINTNRGRGVALGQTRFTAQSEFGFSQKVEGVPLNAHHYYFVDDEANPTTYVDAMGNPVDRSDREAPPVYLQFADNPFPGQTFNNASNVYQNGTFQRYGVSMLQNTESTNFAVSVNSMQETGPLINNEGYGRNSFRVNLDHRFREHFSLGLSVYHARTDLDIPNVNWQNLIGAPPDADLTLRDENGEFIRIPNPQVGYENPLWLEGSRDNDRQQARTLAGANLRYEPLDWLSFSGNVSYDRQDGDHRMYVPKGTPIGLTTIIPSDGLLVLNDTLSDTWNAEAQVSLRRDFGDLNVRTTGRTILEMSKLEATSAQASNFFVQGVPRMDAAASRNSASWTEEVLSQGYLWDTALDYQGKYILTGLLRYDGSSLFGPDNRWHAYYRAAGAWRVSEEEWFDIPAVNELKLSAARGTAGGRPLFSHQYETWSVGSGGVAKGALGNRDLRPEHTTEQELSVEAILFDRVGVEVTQSWQRTTDQLVNAALPAAFGYVSQWQNGGVVEGNATEITLEAQLLERANFRWTSMFVYDRSDATIVEWPFACQRPANRMWCEGYSMYAINGTKLATDPRILSQNVTGDPEAAPHHGGAVAASGRADEFVVNDEGFLVWVGPGNSYTDGITEGLWGTTTTIAGVTYEWGIPFWILDEAGSPRREQLGQQKPQNFGFNNLFEFGQFSVNMLWNATIGYTVADQYHWRLPESLHPKKDQAGKPDELKKPERHYWAIGNPTSTPHLEKGNYLKLRSLGVNYQLSLAQLNQFGLGGLGIESMKIGLAGRDLLNFNTCTCPDPEPMMRFDDRTYRYPANYPANRSFTAQVELAF